MALPKALQQVETNAREQVVHVLRKIQEAAHDGHGGSPDYAKDRLALIQALATTAIARLED